MLKLQRQADKLYDAGEEEAANKTHKPNLLNTVVWLVETAQQVLTPTPTPTPTPTRTPTRTRTLARASILTLPPSLTLTRTR